LPPSTNHFVAPDPDAEELPSDDEYCLETENPTIIQMEHERSVQAIDLTKDNSDVIDLTSEPEMPEIHPVHTSLLLFNTHTDDNGHESPSDGYRSYSPSESNENEEDEDMALDISPPGIITNSQAANLTAIPETIEHHPDHSLDSAQYSDSDGGDDDHNDNNDGDIESHLVMGSDAHSDAAEQSHDPTNEITDGERDIDDHGSESLSDEEAASDFYNHEEQTGFHSEAYFEDDMSESDVESETSLFETQSSPTTDIPSSPPLVPQAKDGNIGIQPHPTTVMVQTPVNKSTTPLVGHASLGGLSLLESQTQNPAPIHPPATAFAAVSKAESRSGARQTSPSNVALCRSQPASLMRPDQASQQVSLSDRHPDRHECSAAKGYDRKAVMISPTSPRMCAVRESARRTEEVNAFDSTLAGGDQFPTDAAERNTSVPRHIFSYQPLVDVTWESSGTSFINSPQFFDPLTTERERTRLQSPGYDMASAFAYQRSKQMIGDDKGIKRLTVKDICNKEFSPAASDVRVKPCGLEQDQIKPVEVKDLVRGDTGATRNGEQPVPAKQTERFGTAEISPNNSPASGTKRSAEIAFENKITQETEMKPVQQTQASETIPSVLSRRILNPRLHIPRPSSIFSTTTSKTDSNPVRPSTASVRHISTLTRQSSPSPGFPSVAVTVQQETRPIKRRRFAQFAAYALGTAFGGAAVFAGMLASAPPASFMMEHS
jgi:hypothetical protein